MLRLFAKPLQDNRLVHLSKHLLDDLEISVFLARYFINPETYVTCDTEAIKERNEICISLLRHNDLTAAFQRLYDITAQITKTSSSIDNEPMQVIRNMMGIRTFYDALQQVLQTIKVSGGLPVSFTSLSEALAKLLNEVYPENFDCLWNKYACGTEKTLSLSYQINFTKELTISAAALTGTYDRRYMKSSFIKRITGTLNQMHVDSLLTLVPGHYSEMNQLIDPQKEATSLQRFSHSVHKMLSMQTAAIKQQVNEKERSIARKMSALMGELHFALGMVKYAQAISVSSEHVCFAEILDMKEQTLFAEKMVHPVLAERVDAVPNDIAINKEKKLILLGGANRGGKTTYLRTAGAIQLLFQMGLPIPAAAAKISPASCIVSVFSREEKTELYQGKLDQELTDMREAVQRMDEHSMFLGNEPISGTSPMESCLLSRESLCLLKAKRTRGIWVTHFYELFDDIPKFNRLNFGSRFTCMHTDSANDKHSFCIIPGLPEKHSRAQEVFDNI